LLKSRDEDEVLSKPERNTLSSSSFDNVIYNAESWPEFAVEFDGPHHHQDAKQRASDIRKNLLCQQARFPLLRIGDEFLTEYEKTTLLEYLIQRFVAWKKDQSQIYFTLFPARHRSRRLSTQSMG
jgi:hypothetical protein